MPSQWHFRDRGISGNSAVSGNTAVAETRLERHLQQYRKGRRGTPRSSGKPRYFQKPRPRYFRKPRSSAPTFSIMLEVPSQWGFRNRGISGNRGVPRLRFHTAGGAFPIGFPRPRYFRKARSSAPTFHTAGGAFSIGFPRPRYFRKPRSSAPTFSILLEVPS